MAESQPSISSENDLLSTISGNGDRLVEPFRNLRHATVVDVLDSDTEDEQIQKLPIERSDHPISYERVGQYFIDYYKQICSFIYFATGTINRQNILKCFPNGMSPTVEEMGMVHEVVNEIGNKLTDGFGLQIVLYLLFSPPMC